MDASANLLDVLVVGATAEIPGIKDLMDLSARTDDEDILLVYGNPTKRPCIHHHPFHAWIERSAASYAPQFISAELFAGIINLPMERRRRYMQVSMSAFQASSTGLPGLEALPFPGMFTPAR